IHWLAPAMYLLPWFDNVRIDLTLAGLRESLFAIVGFAIGSELMMAVSRRDHIGVYTVATREGTALESRLLTLLLISGLVLYGLFPLAGRLPSATAIVSTGSTLAVIGIGLK